MKARFLIRYSSEDEQFLRLKKSPRFYHKNNTVSPLSRNLYKDFLNRQK